jgi:hypothetical protein
MAVSIEERLSSIERDLNRILERTSKLATVDLADAQHKVYDSEINDIFDRLRSLTAKVDILEKKLSLYQKESGTNVQ